MVDAGRLTLVCLMLDLAVSRLERGRGPVLCCVVVCCVVLCCVVLCCVVLCCVVLCCVVLCCVVLCCVVLCCVVLFCVVLCCDVLCCVVLCCEGYEMAGRSLPLACHSSCSTHARCNKKGVGQH